MKPKFSYLVIAVSMTLFLTSWALGTGEEPADGVSQIYDVRVSNITSSSAVISWVTDGETTGMVYYGTNPANLAYTASDDTLSDTHWVQLSGLEPDTTYHFQVTSDGITEEGFSFHTFGVGAGIPYTLYGQVYEPGGVDTEERAIVYVSLLRDGDESSLLSALTDSDGMWYVDLGNLKDPDTGEVWDWQEGDVIRIEAITGISGKAGPDETNTVTGVSPQDCYTLTLSWTTVDIDLARDLTLITLPIEPWPGSYTSHGLISALSPDCVKVTMWDRAQKWVSAIRDIPPDPVNNPDFDLLLGEGYFVQMDAPVTWHVEGLPVDGPITLDLEQGLNLVGIPYPGGLSASELLSSGGGIPGCVMVVGWDEELQLWKDLTDIGGDTPLGEDFEIYNDRGYFVQVTGPVTWTPSGGGPGGPRKMTAHRPRSLRVLSDRKLSRLLDVGVSNLSSASATISWYTDGMGRGEIIYGERPDKLDKTLQSAHASAAHMVRLKGLKPDTIYYYKVITEDGRGKVESPVLSFRTSRIGAGMTYTVWGRLVDYEGAPLSGKGVYLRVKGDGGESSLLCCISDEEGRWWFDLGNLKRERGDAYVYRKGDEMELRVMPNGDVLLRGRVEGERIQYVGEMVVPYEMREVVGMPGRSELLQNYPNPFNPETWIPFKLDRGGEVRIEIYDMSGRLVKRLELGYLRAGYYVDRSKAAYWDGRNEQGEQVASGIYFYILKAGNFRSTRKMSIIR